jgi:hypothetical protein
MIYLLLLFILSANAEKFCINCKHFQKNILTSSSIYGKCKLFPKETHNKIEFLISGSPKMEYRFCSTVREDENMCSPTGKYYEKKCTLKDYLKIKF